MCRACLFLWRAEIIAYDLSPTETEAIFIGFGFINERFCLVYFQSMPLSAGGARLTPQALLSVTTHSTQASSATK